MMFSPRIIRLNPWPVLVLIIGSFAEPTVNGADLCRDCVRVWLLDSESFITDRFDYSDSLPSCGPPISWEDVQVVEVSDSESIPEAIEEQLGGVGEYTDIWHGLEYSVPKYQVIRRAQKAFGKNGCSLLILGPVRTERSVGASPVSPIKRQDYFLIRWGLLKRQ